MTKKMSIGVCGQSGYAISQCGSACSDTMNLLLFYITSSSSCRPRRRQRGIEAASAQSGGVTCNTQGGQSRRAACEQRHVSIPPRSNSIGRGCAARTPRLATKVEVMVVQDRGQNEHAEDVRST